MAETQFRELCAICDNDSDCFATRDAKTQRVPRETLSRFVVKLVVRTFKIMS